MDVNFPLEPPVNNLIQPTLYDRIGAITFEKIRVANSQLDTRLTIQEKVINKYRKDAERVHQMQTKRIRGEMKKIRKRKPNYVGDDGHLDLIMGGGGKLHVQDSLSSKDGGRRSLSDSSDCSFCRRYYSHHYNVKDTSIKANKDSEKKDTHNDFFNSRFRCFFMNVVRKNHETATPPLDETPRPDLIGRDGRMISSTPASRAGYQQEAIEGPLVETFGAINLKDGTITTNFKRGAETDVDSSSPKTL